MGRDEEGSIGIADDSSLISIVTAILYAGRTAATAARNAGLRVSGELDNWDMEPSVLDCMNEAKHIIEVARK